MPKATVKVKLITLNEALTNDDPQLYVMNRAQTLPELKGQTGNITMNVHSNSRTVGVSIPHSWIPFDLTTQAPRDHILAEPNFRRLVARGALAILDSKSAEEFMMNNEGTYEELQRHLNQFSDVENTLKSFSNEQSNELDIVVPNAAAVAVVKSNPNDAINAFVEAICLRSETESADDLISELTSQLHNGGLTEAHIQYIMDNVTSVKIKEWCVNNI